MTKACAPLLEIIIPIHNTSEGSEGMMDNDGGGFLDNCLGRLSRCRREAVGESIIANFSCAGIINYSTAGGNFESVPELIVVFFCAVIVLSRTTDR